MCFVDIFMDVNLKEKVSKMSKYKNIKEYRIINKEKVIFDSKKEAKRYDELYALLKARKIKELVLQPEYRLMDMQKHDGVTYRGVKYVADFKYIRDDIQIVEDVKSDFTRKKDVYRVKIKWFLSLYGESLIFREV